MKEDNLDDKFDIDIPLDEPVFPVSIVCELLQIQYYMLHEIIKEGILRERKRKKHKKLFSQKDVRLLKYVKYLVEERGVNLKGVKVILEMEQKD
ncbi:MAG: MerR family transcriptional regulator [Candidatus Omnitrophica bacterium]|jgi:MerR family transcriptional regulator/heat shock protein HspR|nr:MerR family transcriptional regulator [Candidatus Omnitrophota bacterium]